MDASEALQELRINDDKKLRFDDDDEDEEINEDTAGGSIEQHKSVIYHLLSQISIGMDLTRVVLPTFILEKRSMLEMQANYFAYTDAFVNIANQKTAKSRFVACVKFYLSTIAAGRKSGWGKKPYNPILGEYFQCFYEDTSSKQSVNKAKSGPVPWAKTNQVAIIVEKVSHHPLVVAAYAECQDAGIQYDGHIWTKSKFYGLSVGVDLVGEARIKLVNLDEEYIITLPSIVFRSIFTVPWSEFCGNSSVVCAKTGYRADIKFHPKPFYAGKRDCLTGELFEPSCDTPFARLDGTWSEQVNITYPNKKKGGREALFSRTKMRKSKKRVRHLDLQETWESRRHWVSMTKALREGDLEGAQDIKLDFEARQRKIEKERREKGTRYEPQYFANIDGDINKWTYKYKLSERIKKS